MKRTLILSSIAACSLGLVAVPAAGAAPAAVSANWSGYEASTSTGGFSAVSGGWVQPRASCTAGSPSYSAFWVGIGGGGRGSSALEQVGTQSNCTADGSTSYYAWYELVPAAPVRLSMSVRPGDRMYARVTVHGSTVTVSLKNHTTGVSDVRTLHMANPAPDTSTAEWVAEAPSACNGGAQGQCTPLPLSDFGTVKFTNAFATANGHTGSIADPSWESGPITLSPSGGSAYASYGYGGSDTGMSSQAGAQPSSLSTDGSDFAVNWVGSGGSGGSTSAADGGYGDSSGYGDPGAYGYSGTGGDSGDAYGYGYGDGGIPADGGMPGVYLYGY